MSFGVMGGAMQPQGHAQLMIRMFDHHQDPQSAIDAPRWQVFPDMEVALEPGIPDDVVRELTGRGHQVSRGREFWWFGGAQAIYRTNPGNDRREVGRKVGRTGGKKVWGEVGKKVAYCGGSDPRKDGQAVGY